MRSLLNCAARKKDDALQFLIVEKVVERPQATRLIWIRIIIRIIAVDIAFIQSDFFVDSGPQCRSQYGKLIR